MKIDELTNIVEKAKILINWCDEYIDEYHRPSITLILKLLIELEKVGVE